MRSIVAAAAAVVLLCVGSAAGAADLAAAGVRAQQAADQLTVIANRPSNEPQPLRQSNPAVGPLLDVAFDASSIPENPSIDDLGVIMDWLQTSSRISMLYMITGTGATDVSQLSNPQVAARAEQNIRDYAQEYGRNLDFSLRAARLAARGVDRFLASNPDLMKDPVRAEGLAKVYHDLAGGMRGALMAVGDRSALSDAWCKDRMPGLLALGSQLSRSLSPGDAQTLHTLALKAANDRTAPDLKADLVKLAKIIAPTIS